MPGFGGNRYAQLLIFMFLFKWNNVRLQHGTSDHVTDVLQFIFDSGTAELVRRGHCVQAPGRKLPVTDDELPQHAPCELIRNALPAALATQLLQVPPLLS